jgi:Ca-activated chloride channel homolog
MHQRNDLKLPLAILILIFLCTWALGQTTASPSSTNSQSTTVPAQPPVSSVPPPAPVPSSSQTAPSTQPSQAQPATTSTQPTQSQPATTTQPGTTTHTTTTIITEPAATTPGPSGGAQPQNSGATPTSTQQNSTSAPQQQAPPSSGIGAGEGPAEPPAPITPPAGAAQRTTPQQGGNSQQPPAAGQENAPANGQDQGQSPANDKDTFVFRAEVQEVILHATVLDDKQRLVTNLDKTAFTVFEDSKPQTITSFRHEDIPVAMGIVIDNSGSMREKRDRVNKAAINLVRASNPNDEVFVVNFNDEYYLDQDFTSSIPKLREALEKVESRGGTALYDALVATADHLKKNARLEKKVVFVVTDGEDNASRESLETAIQRLQQENGPTVYAIGILGEEKQRRARRALQEIASRTGGVAFLPRTLDEVDEISSSVAHDIRNQYTIGYKPTTPKSVPGYRTIHVDARAKGYGKLTVRTRSGYYPGQEKGPSGGGQ